jgi:hypothetical protein
MTNTSFMSPLSWFAVQGIITVAVLCISISLAAIAADPVLAAIAADPVLAAIAADRSLSQNGYGTT